MFESWWLKSPNSRMQIPQSIDFSPLIHFTQWIYGSSSMKYSSLVTPLALTTEKFMIEESGFLVLCSIKSSCTLSWLTSHFKFSLIFYMKSTSQINFKIHHKSSIMCIYIHIKFGVSLLSTFLKLALTVMFCTFKLWCASWNNVSSPLFTQISWSKVSEPFIS